MWRRFIYLLLLSPLLLSQFCFADLQYIQQQAALKKLAAEQDWLNIIHFQSGESFVDDERFFLAENGKFDPQSELDASIQFLLTDEKAYCQFPYRRQWLSEHLPSFKAALPDYTCKDYQVWRDHISAHSVTLVLAASFLNSPSSMYGHTFIRFDKEGSESDLNAYAVSFAAMINDGGGFMYTYNGLFGGYPGRFSDAPYHKKIKEYSRLDNRDMWEYKLNLNADETNRLVAHLWEVNNINFDYYFFDENCAFRLLELIEVARSGIELTDNIGVSAIPIDTIREVADADLVASIKYRPSNQRKLQHKINRLNPQDQQLAWELAERKVRWQDLHFETSEGQRAYQIAELAYLYLRYKNNRKARDQADAELSLALLRIMNSWASYRQDTAPPQPIRPESGHESRSLTAYASYHDGYEQGFLDIEWKASYHDLMDNLAGYPESISLNLIQAKLRAYEEGEINVQEVNILEVSSLSPSSKFFVSNSWRTRLGFERLSFIPSEDSLVEIGESIPVEEPDVDDVSVWFGEGGYGKTYNLFSGLNMYMLGAGRLEFNKEMKHDVSLGLGAQLGFYVQSNVASWFMEGRFYQFVEDEQRIEASTGLHFALSRNNGLRLQAKYYDFDDNFESYSEAQLAWRWHYR